VPPYDRTVGQCAAAGRLKWTARDGRHREPHERARRVEHRLLTAAGSAQAEPAAAALGHPVDAVRCAGGYELMRTFVASEPSLVVEVDTEACWEQDSWRDLITCRRV